MSNKVYLNLTVFTTVDENGKEYEKTFGYRLYDNYANVYNNTFQSIKHAHEEIKKRGIMEIIQSHDKFVDLDTYTCSAIFYNNTIISEKEFNELDMGKTKDE